MFFRAFLLIACLLAPATPAVAEKRVALVIGNADYKETARLINTRNDASDMIAALKRLGFDVLDGLDLDKRGMERLIRQFEQKLAGAEIALFFYAGHGVQISGQNHLVPVDARLAAEGDVDFESLPLSLVLSRMERTVKTSLVLLDACRDNPLARNLARTMGTRAANVGQGLAEVRTGVGTLISFSTQPGNVALDGTGRNSPYTTALLAEIETPGRDILTTLAAVRGAVVKATNGRQVPWEHTSLLGPVVLKGGAAVAPAASSAPPPEKAQGSKAERGWALIKDSDSKPLLESFVRGFGDTFYGALAKQKLGAIAAAEALVKHKAAEAKSKADQAALVASIDRKQSEMEINLRKGAEATQNAYAASKAADAEKQKTAKGSDPMPKTPVANLERPAQGSDPAPSDLTRPGRVFRDCNDGCPEMVVIPAGSFTMGSNDNDNEKPPRMVSIAKPFAVGKYEVTFAEWAACAAGGGCAANKAPGDQGWGKGRRPVIDVSWNDAKEYVAWLSAKTGKIFRLLTEAEWEYAARSGTTTAYCFGDTISTSQAQFSEGQWGSARQTVEVGKFPPNAFNLHDMHGNVWEWVEDCGHDNYSGAPSDGTKAAEFASCRRVLRGGSWGNNPRSLRSAFREGGAAGDRGHSLGFRVARTF